MTQEYKEKFPYLDFLLLMTKKDLNVSSKRSFLSLVWEISTPIIKAFILSFILSFMLVSKDNNYFLFILSGLISWSFFAKFIKSSAIILVDEQNLIKKAVFPRELLLIKTLIVSFIPYFITSLLILLFVSFSSVNFGVAFAYFIKSFFLFSVLSIFLAFFSLAVALFFSILVARVKKFMVVIDFIIQLSFFMVPIFYARDLLPNNLAGILSLNPLFQFIEMFRSIFLDLGMSFQEYLINGLFSILFLVFSLDFFRKQSKKVDDWL
jgi:ABC-type polysaccharide/polyol phosphate export permease